MITLGVNDILPNFVAGGMDDTEVTYAWNYTVRSCRETELEELHNGRLGFSKAKGGGVKGGSVMLDGFGGGPLAWLEMGQGVTICGRRMRQTHLLDVYVEWTNLDRKGDADKRYTAPVEERKLENLRIEWSYIVGRSHAAADPSRDQNGGLLGEEYTG
jgi:hypothetical protein